MSTTEREDSLRLPYGDLHLVERTALADGLQISGVPGTWSPRTDGRRGAHVDLPVGNRVEISGRSSIVPTTGVDLEDGDVLAVDDRLELMVRVEPDEQTWLQVFDTRADLARAFVGIERFPSHSEWKVDASFESSHGSESFNRTRDGDRLFTLPRSGWMKLTVAGTELSLAVTRFGDLHVLSFRDSTSDDESHGAGRLIWLPREPTDIDHIDFNSAVLPPCAFNPLVSCPIPAARNVVPIPVRAGERRAVFDGPTRMPQLPDYCY